MPNLKSVLWIAGISLLTTMALKRYEMQKGR